MDTICTHCKSNRIIKGVRITDLGESNMKYDLSLEIYKNPEALLFKGTTKYTLKDSVCCGCGKVETYIENPEKLWDDYKNNKN